jgi:hypothetical protein
MAKKERNRGSVDRARAKRGSAGDMSAEEFDAALARMRTAASFDAETQNEDYFRGMSAPEAMRLIRGPQRPTPRPARASTLAPTSTRDKPVPRPAGLAERADLRKAMDSSDAAFRASKREAADREMGMKAGGKVKKMQAGGKCRGMGAATRGGNFSRG